MAFDPNPETRNPLKFSDVAYGCSLHWCVSEKAALKYLETNFKTPREARQHVQENLTGPPDAFWEQL
jgi:hypothetical protein